MKEHLPEHVMWELAREIQKLGPRDHGENKNRWGTVKARVKEARDDLDLPKSGWGTDNKTVWDMVKRLNYKQRSAA